MDDELPEEQRQADGDTDLAHPPQEGLYQNLRETIDSLYHREVAQAQKELWDAMQELIHDAKIKRSEHRPWQGNRKKFCRRLSQQIFDTSLILKEEKEKRIQKAQMDREERLRGLLEYIHV